LAIYKKLTFLAASGNCTQFFLNQLLTRETYEKLPETILACMKTVILDFDQLEDDSTFEEYKACLDPTSHRAVFVQYPPRKLILEEQAIRFTYGRVGTFEFVRESSAE
jgi:hypothetical protein